MHKTGSSSLLPLDEREKHLTRLKEDQAQPALLVLEDGTSLEGVGLGKPGCVVGELCFNTAMTGYQEILSDPSYAQQIVVFTFPHIGNVGTNDEDCEATFSACRGIVLREQPSAPSNWRAQASFSDYLATQGLTAIAGIDTRALTQYLRDHGAQKAVIAFSPDEPPEVAYDREALLAKVRAWPGLKGADLASTVSCKQPYSWPGPGLWQPGSSFAQPAGAKTPHVVAVDFGIKHNILRALADLGGQVTVVPATTPARDILALLPDGVFLSNGPGDPAASAAYAVPMIQELLEEKDLPIFGICLGHQLLALTLGGRCEKMHLGHHGGNHPVKNLVSGRVEITSQNHGFVVVPESLPAAARVTHVSLFDGTNEGFCLEGRPVFSVQFHPEASPGPKDSLSLFQDFAAQMAARRRH